MRSNRNKVITCLPILYLVGYLLTYLRVQVCWVKNTYYIPHGEVAKPGVTKHHIGYYQWVPVVLLVQAFLFYWPCLAWRVFSERSGININNMVEAADTIQNALYPERRDKTIK
jgi:innexin